MWNQFFIEQVSGYYQELMIFDSSRNWNFILKATFRTKGRLVSRILFWIECAPRIEKFCVCGRIAWDRLDLDSSRKVFWNLDFKRLVRICSKLREIDFSGSERCAFLSSSRSQRIENVSFDSWKHHGRNTPLSYWFHEINISVVLIRLLPICSFNFVIHLWKCFSYHYR